MAEPIDFFGSNAVYKPVPGDEAAISPLPSYSNGEEVITCWKLSDLEKKVVEETGEIWLSHLTWGRPFYPCKVSGTPLMYLFDKDTKQAIDGYRSDGNHVVRETLSDAQDEAASA